MNISCIMHENEISMYKNNISMHENEKVAPKTFMDDNSMHDIVQKSLISYENFRGGKIIPRNLLSNSAFIFMHGN